jgi:RNA polymerase sigma-70 factor (ECF subfamily)
LKQLVNPNNNDAEPVQPTADAADYKKQTDTSLIKQYSEGDLLAFETLYKRHKGGLYRYFMRHIPDPNLAEDLYQDIWSKVIVQAKQYKASAKFTTWLYTLAHNKLVDHVRHLTVVNKVVVQSFDEETADSPEVFKSSPIHNQSENDLTSIRDAESLKQCIGQLPQAQKDSFLLKEEAGLTVKDIATILNISFEASKSRLRYAYVNLRQCLYVKTGRAV